MELSLPDAVREACSLLAVHRKQAFVVGGAVRDLLLGGSPQDWDLATDALPQDVERIFTSAGYRSFPTGLRFGTVTVFINDFPLEITTFRLEEDYPDFRHPARVHFAGDITTDLKRRDFTINALAYDPGRLLLHDPFGGMEDLARGEIRSVGTAAVRVTEDPLRMMRGVRLTAEFGFHLADQTWHAIVRNAELIHKISADRVRDELNKIFMARNFLEGLGLLKESGLLFLIIPELKESWLFSQYHPSHQYTVLTHTFEALRYAPASLTVRLAVLLHDVGKPRCFSRGEDGRGHFYGHNRLGAEMAEHILRRLHYRNSLIRNVAALIREHMLDLHMGPGGMRRLVARLGRELAPDLLALRMADFLAHSTEIVRQDIDDYEEFHRRLETVLQEDGLFKVGDLAINGRDVMEFMRCGPCPAVGRILRQIQDEILNDPEKNNRPFLLGRIRELTAGMDPGSDHRD